MAGDASDAKEPPSRLVEPTTDQPPFPREFLDTVFLAPDPPPSWPRTFAVVTACNPGARIAADEANRAACAALDAHLDAAGVDSFVVVGASPDLAHRETGRGFATRDLAAAAALARRFGQVAFFWVEDGLVLVCTDASGRGWPVARWSERLRDAAGE